MTSIIARLLLPLVAVAFWIDVAAGPAPQPPAAGLTDATVIAQVLAGVEPAPGDARIDRLVASPEWRSHRDWVQGRWTQVQARLASMSRWRETSLPLADGDKRTLLYPFSGPDF